MKNIIGIGRDLWGGPRNVAMEGQFKEKGFLSEYTSPRIYYGKTVDAFGLHWFRREKRILLCAFGRFWMIEFKRR